MRLQFVLHAPFFKFLFLLLFFMDCLIAHEEEQIIEHNFHSNHTETFPLLICFARVELHEVCSTGFAKTIFSKESK